MLIKLKFYIPEIVLGVLLAVAIFAMGFEFASSRDQPSNPKSAAQGDKKSDESAPDEGWRHWLTHDAAGFFTLWLVVVGALQLGLFIWQLRLIRESLDDTKVAADAAKEAANAAKTQARIAEESLTKLERPYVFIFGVGKIIPNPAVNDFFVEYTVANYGKMPAIIEGAWIDFVIDNEGDPQQPPLHDSHTLLVSPILQPGEKRGPIRGYIPAGMTDGSVAVILPADLDQPITGSEPVAPNFTAGGDIFFRATITYRGPFSSDHETGALWLYNPGSFEFSIRGGQKYNYVK